MCELASFVPGACDPNCWVMDLLAQARPGRPLRPPPLRVINGEALPLRTRLPPHLQPLLRGRQRARPGPARLALWTLVPPSATVLVFLLLNLNSLDRRAVSTASVPPSLPVLIL